MIGTYDWSDDGRIINLQTINNLWIAKTDDIVFEELRKLGHRIPYITTYLWIHQEDAIKWAHYSLREIKQLVEEESFGDHVRFHYKANNKDYIIAYVKKTGLICDTCNSPDW